MHENEDSQNSKQETCFPCRFTYHSWNNHCIKWRSPLLLWYCFFRYIRYISGKSVIKLSTTIMRKIEVPNMGIPFVLLYHNNTITLSDIADHWPNTTGKYWTHNQHHPWWTSFTQASWPGLYHWEFFFYRSWRSPGENNCTWWQVENCSRSQQRYGPATNCMLNQTSCIITEDKTLFLCD